MEEIAQRRIKRGMGKEGKNRWEGKGEGKMKFLLFLKCFRPPMVSKLPFAIVCCSKRRLGTTFHPQKAVTSPQAQFAKKNMSLSGRSVPHFTAD